MRREEAERVARELDAGAVPFVAFDGRKTRVVVAYGGRVARGEGPGFVSAVVAALERIEPLSPGGSEVRCG